MTTTAQPMYTDSQVSAWLRGLLTIAWADGNFDAAEQEAIAQLTQDRLAPRTDLGNLEPIEADELAETLGSADPELAENFMRTAVLVAIADGVYSESEYTLIHNYQSALGLELEALEALEHTLYRPRETPDSSKSASSTASASMPSSATGLQPPNMARVSKPDVLKPLKHWLDGMDVNDPRVARFICKMVPAQCPFERDVTLFGRKVVHIPAMCKINPVYDQLVGLRFRSLSYLADDCQEDISEYC